MDWFHEQSTEREVVDVPSTDGLLTGCLSRLKAKEGVVSCRAAREVSGCEFASMHPKLIALSGIKPGDTIAFALARGPGETPVVCAPIWRYVVNSGARCDDLSFPEFVGFVRPFASGDGGLVESPLACSSFGRNPYIQKAHLVAGDLSDGDLIAFGLRTNSKGNPHVADPLFKSLLQTSFEETCPKHSLEQTPPPQRLQHSSAFTSNWTELALELFLRSCSASGYVGLVRCSSTCTTWQKSLASCNSDLEGFWVALCCETYPQMVEKVLASEFAAAAPGLPLVEILRLTSDHPTYWRSKFASRCLRQRRWDAERLEQQRLRQQRLEVHKKESMVEDKQRGQNFRGQSSRNETKVLRATRTVRVRTCRRCGQSFLPAENPMDGCRWHRGQYGRVGESGAMEEVMSEARVRQAVRVSGRKSKGRQAHIVVPGTVFGRGGADQECVWEWSCCGSRNMVASGCCCGPHS